jgi:hypothetical protein
MESVRFEGIVVEEQTHYMCRADGGVIRVPKKDIQIVDGSAHLRKGAIVEFVRSPIGEVTGRGQQEAGASPETSACLGGVEIACASGTVLGSCTGISPCS